MSVTRARMCVKLHAEISMIERKITWPLKSKGWVMQRTARPIASTAAVPTRIDCRRFFGSDTGSGRCSPPSSLKEPIPESQRLPTAPIFSPSAPTADVTPVTRRARGFSRRKRCQSKA